MIATQPLKGEEVVRVEPHFACPLVGFAGSALDRRDKLS
jgi:hypothetical protein